MEKEFITLKLKDIHPYPNNPRINDDAVKDVVASIEQTGNLDPIEVDENNVILSGHTRLKALKRLKYNETQCVRYTGLSDDEKRKYRLLANKTGEKALWDDDLLSVELDGLDFDGFDFGFELSDGGVQTTEVSEDDYNGEVPEEPKAKIGDLYRLGDHLLMCGDSTDEAIIEKLLNGVKADLLLTDPPYGIQIVSGGGGTIGTGNWKRGGVEHSTSRRGKVGGDAPLHFRQSRRW